MANLVSPDEQEWRHPPGHEVQPCHVQGGGHGLPRDREGGEDGGDGVGVGIGGGGLLPHDLCQADVKGGSVRVGGEGLWGQEGRGGGGGGGGGVSRGAGVLPECKEKYIIGK